jgi:hypothetical protein
MKSPSTALFAVQGTTVQELWNMNKSPKYRKIGTVL